MIFIVVKFKVKPDWSERWLDLVDGLHPGHPAGARQPLVRLVPQRGRTPTNSSWSKPSRTTPPGTTSTASHFKQAMADMPQALVETPRIISRQLDGEGWDRMGELTI